MGRSASVSSVEEYGPKEGPQKFIDDTELPQSEFSRKVRPQALKVDVQLQFAHSKCDLHMEKAPFDYDASLNQLYEHGKRLIAIA